VSFGATRHWNAEGHRVVATTIMRHLAQAGVVTPAAGAPGRPNL
jgi:hypothetical protein